MVGRAALQAAGSSPGGGAAASEAPAGQATRQAAVAAASRARARDSCPERYATSLPYIV